MSSMLDQVEEAFPIFNYRLVIECTVGVPFALQCPLCELQVDGMRFLVEPEREVGQIRANDVIVPVDDVCPDVDLLGEWD